VPPLARHRLALCLLALLAAVAGCVGAPTAPASDGTTTTPTTTATQTPTTRALPEPPDAVTRETATAFAVEREEAVVYNREIPGNDRVVVNCEVRSANRTADGFRVHLGCGFSTYDYHPDEDVTAHGDGFSRAVYVVNESGVSRSEE
jgi:outer membrane receptor protein involved in Fe transport